MSFELRLVRQAARCLERLETTTQHRIVGRLEEIAEDPFGPQTKVLRNAHGFRSDRVGAYRILYSVDDDKRLINVTVIGPRGQVYRELN